MKERLSTPEAPKVPENSNRWFLALECAGDGVWDWNAVTNEVYFSTLWKQMLGFQEEEIGTSLDEWKSRVHPEDLDACLKDLESHFNGETDIYANEHRMLCKDGSYKWILDRGQVIEWKEDGSPKRVIGTHKDISQRKQVEEDKQKAEAQLWSAFEYAAIGMALVSPEGRFMRVNPALCRIIGYSAKELLGTTFQNITHPDDLETDLGFVKRMLNGEIAAYEMDKRYFHKDGHIVWIHLSVSLVRKADGDPDHFIAQIQDISEQKRYEQELKEARLNAEAADMAKSNFLAMMSHEIRTPMNAIIGYADLLGEGDLSHDQRDFLHSITSSGELLLTLINDILDFSKIEAGELDIENRPFALHPCLEETVGLLYPRATEKGIELAFRMQRGLPEIIIGDEHRLRQVLINLINNALKFTNEGCVTIDITADYFESQADQLRLSIADTGIGMSPEQMGRLFRPFSQADSSTTRRFGGTGLGLAICRRLVEAMGGDIDVESELNKGSIFRFSIPLHAADANQLDAPKQHSRSALQGRKVLVVDSHGISRQILSHQLRRLGLLVSEHMTQDGMLAAHDREAADLIICNFEDSEDLNLDDIVARIDGKHPIIVVAHPESVGFLSKYPVHILRKPLRQSQLLDLLMSTFAELNSETEQTKEISFAQRHPGSILVVEDNQANLNLLLRLLHSLGYNPDAAMDGEEGLAALRKKRYDVILMDVQMPKINGLEATRRIRESERLLAETSILKIDPLNIIAITADAIKGDRERCLDAGMNDYLAKPVRSHNLREMFRRML